MPLPSSSESGLPGAMFGAADQCKRRVVLPLLAVAVESRRGTWCASDRLLAVLSKCAKTVAERCLFVTAFNLNLNTGTIISGVATSSYGGLEYGVNCIVFLDVAKQMDK